MMLVFFRVLTPSQLARVAVQTMPSNKLDTLALCKCAPDPETEQKLTPGFCADLAAH